VRDLSRIGVLCLVVALGLFAETAAASYPTAADGRIAFQRGDEVFVANADGSNPVAPFATSPPVEQEDPAFSPDGRFVAFTRDLLDGNSAVFVGELATGKATQLTFPTNARIHEDPSFSPDGKRIVFSGDVQDGSAVVLRIFVMNRDGSGLVQLSPDGPDIFDYGPSFSPDGERIVFTRGGTINEIFVMPAAGGAAVSVTSQLNDSFYGSFSPDGSRILLVHDPDPAIATPTRIATIPALGGPATDISGDGDFDYPPVFSPSGNRVLFVNDIDPGMGFDYDLLVMPAGGGAATNLTPDTPEIEGNPDWEAVYRCAGRRATIVGDDGPEKIKGTKKPDVIVTNAGNDKVSGRGGNDRICGGRGKDRISGGAGRDRLLGQQGKDKLAGNAGADVVKGGKGKDSERQ
jgi:Tol biopolymer transport system component